MDEVPLMFKLSILLNLRTEESSMLRTVELLRFNYWSGREPSSQRVPMEPLNQLIFRTFRS